MKITYPECQIEISVDEVIELNKHYEIQIQCLPTELHGLKPVNSIHFGLTENAKRWLEETVHDSLAKLSQQLLDSTDPNRHGDGFVQLIHEEPEPVPYPKEEEPKEDPAPTFEPGGIIGDGDISPEGEGVRPGGLPAAVQEALKHPHAVRTIPEKKAAVKSKAVDVLMDEGWVTFESATQAAKALGVSLAWLSKSLKLGKTCNGHQVRYSNPELDAALAEIEEGKKKPYQPTKPVR